MSEHTPGPWGWFGNVDTKNLYLAAKHSGRQFVMGFTRYGMQSAKPEFNLNSRMVGADELVRFAVCPEATSREDERVYRGDIVDIDHADARLIAAAPELYEAAKNVLDWFSELESREDQAVLGTLREAVAKAEGKA